MQRVAVVSSKILPPRRHSVLPRGRLFNRLRDVLSARLAVVCANVGYGKTALFAAAITFVAAAIN